MQLPIAPACLSLSPGTAENHLIGISSVYQYISCWTTTGLQCKIASSSSGKQFNIHWYTHEACTHVRPTCTVSLWGVLLRGWGKEEELRSSVELPSLIPWGATAEQRWICVYSSHQSRWNIDKDKAFYHKHWNCSHCMTCLLALISEGVAFVTHRIFYTPLCGMIKHRYFCVCGDYKAVSIILSSLYL